MFSFTAQLEIIGINPFVPVPENVLDALTSAAGKTKGPIPIKGSINGVEFQQTLIRYQGAWRLYVNTRMLKNSPKRIGEVLEVMVAFDSSDRSIYLHPKLLAALEQNKQAKDKFDTLTPSLQREIIRYISFLKTEASIDRNIAKAIDFLLGKGPFVGRKAP
ncbi:YdeI/OmpD-associated family protein [Parapedobacter indicus]|uniref:Bacteriocin-protection, YdeI or OmpD-Associated n=1 Tax=Parapedobacter indicus TaxID=1477437 RepID=A0A1I3DPF8_9SPHI|nr:YdeI/OmpD-associated family protein [Parapedobacter indicus]PPL04776.1 uncharacterized protein DUF1905 [Parapedobacter indicus]SFH88459.1 protein of unknown function [Parapedobacter indicus]